VQQRWQPAAAKEPLKGAFFWLTAFYFVYCARPAEEIHFLNYVPLAKITAILTLVSLIMSAGKTPRGIKELPKEASYLFGIIVLLYAAGVFSTIWKSGALLQTIDFSKVFIAWILTFLLVTTLKRIRRIIFLQCASVAVVAATAVIKGHSVPRLNGVIGGLYSNPNDMAFAIVLSLPFCLAFLLSTKSLPRKAAWATAMLVMMVTLFLTASRAGFIDLVIAGSVMLWHFGIKGKRLYLIGATGLLGVVLLPVAGRHLLKRFVAITGHVSSQTEETAYESYEERKFLMFKAVEAIVNYPILGLGEGNFQIYSGKWKDVHASYLQIGAEAGIPALILYLLFFGRGFRNLRYLAELDDLDPEMQLFIGALKPSLIGFVVGACFAPEAYQFFPYFTVCYTSVFVAMARERSSVPEAAMVRTVPRHFAWRDGRSSAFNPIP
jgi:hypothetical protein